MRIPNPTKLIPNPRQVPALAKRVLELVPGLPGRQEAPDRPVSPPPPVPTPTPAEPAAAKPKPPAKPKARAKAKPKPRAKAKAGKAGAKAKSESKPKRSRAQPKTAPAGVAVSGFPEPPGKDPGDRSKDPEPHHALNNPVGEPDPTKWPDHETE